MSDSVSARRQADQALVSDGAATHLHPSGFDPSRWGELFYALANARHALEYWEREAHYAGRNPMWASEPRYRGSEECEVLRGWETVIRPLAFPQAIATEARRAETLGSVHEGAGPQDIAQTLSSSSPSQPNGENNA